MEIKLTYRDFLTDGVEAALGVEIRFVSGDLTIDSGPRLDVDPALGLVGECDFLVALTPVLPMLKAPIVAVITMAKDCDIEDSFG